MKKTVKIALVIALMGLLVSACLPNPRVPISCNGKTVRVKLEDAQAWKEVCAETNIPVAQQPVNCQPAAQAAPAVVSEQPEAVINVASKCGYDYNLMPRGKDATGTPYADYGIYGIGSIVGPAIVQLDSETIVSVYPGISFDVTDATDPVWRYFGNLDCLKSFYQYFPNKEMIIVQ